MIYLYMNKERHIMTIPTKNEMFAEFANCKNIDERIEYIKSIRDVDVNHTLNIEYDNIITKLYSDKQSQEVTDDQGVWSEFAEEGLLQ